MPYAPNNTVCPYKRTREAKTRFFFYFLFNFRKEWETQKKIEGSNLASCKSKGYSVSRFVDELVCRRLQSISLQFLKSFLISTPWATAAPT